jgi:hypothetical protein
MGTAETALTALPIEAQPCCGLVSLRVCMAAFTFPQVVSVDASLVLFFSCHRLAFQIFLLSSERARRAMVQPQVKSEARRICGVNSQTEESIH